MRERTRLFGQTVVAAAVIVGATFGTPAQVPDEFTNREVLPKDISKAELMGVMRGFAGALDVRCSHCHVGPDNLEGMDFATDELAPKRTAREMIKMVRAINGTHLAEIDTGRPAKVEVSCQTCHRGVMLPVAIEDVVSAKLEEGGVEAAMSEYRALRDEHYGSAAYDFSAGPISGLAENLARARKVDEAEALLVMNTEFHPDDVWPRILLAGVHRAKGENDKAIASLRTVLELDPDNPMAKRMIEALEGEGEGEGAGD